MKDPRAWEKYLCPHCIGLVDLKGGSAKICMKIGKCDHGEDFEEKEF